MRVVLAAETFLPRLNGVVNSVIHVARHLRDRGIPVLIVSPDGYASSEFEGIPVERLRSVTVPGVPDYDLVTSSFGRCRRIVEEFDPTVVHLASPFVLGARMQAAAHALDIPTVAVFQTDVGGFANHYGLRPLAGLAHALVRRIHGEADLTLVPSTSCEAYLGGLGVPRVRLWGRGVDLDQFQPGHRSAEIRGSWGSQDRVVVGFVGRLAPEKMVERLVHLASHPRARLVIVGDGPSRAYLERALPDAVFTGRLAGRPLGEAMASLDVLVAPGENETFCQVVQEAMASGVPVVAPDVGGPRDLVAHGRTGLRYAAGDARGMVLAVDRLASNPGLRARMGRTARATVAGRDWGSVVDELIDHYRSVAPLDRLEDAA